MAYSFASLIADNDDEDEDEEGAQKVEAKGRGGLYHQGDRGDLKALAGVSDAYEAAGLQGRRMTEERWWKSFGCTAPFVAEPL